jgi:hypothetical protein
LENTSESMRGYLITFHAGESYLYVEADGRVPLYSSFKEAIKHVEDLEDAFRNSGYEPSWSYDSVVRVAEVDGNSINKLVSGHILYAVTSKYGFCHGYKLGVVGYRVLRCGTSCLASDYMYGNVANLY